MTEAKEGRLLVVDDEPDVAEVTRYSLIAQGFEVDEANSGKDALAMLEAGDYDLVILDLAMPEISGWEVLAKIREKADGPTLPVIIQSALVSTDDIVRGLESGANDYVLKPVDFAELAARIRSQLRMRSLYKKLGSEDETGEAASGEVGASAGQLMRRIEIPLQKLRLAIGIAKAQADQGSRPLLENVIEAVDDLMMAMADTAK